MPAIETPFETPCFFANSSEHRIAAAAPSLVVSLTHLTPDPALTVGAAIAASTTKVGRVVDLAGVEKQALAKYTQDAGNHVSIELRPAATLTLP